MAIRCLIVDDEQHALQVLESLIKRTDGLELAGAYSNPLEAISANLESRPPDIAFLDVDMPRLNGLELARRFPESTAIVFTTSFREYAADAYEQAAADYLLKPILYERFLKCIDRIRQQLKVRKEPATLFFKDTHKGRQVAVSLKDVIFISAALNYSQIHLKDKEIMVYSGINTLAKQLPSSFCRVHRSYVVNLEQVQSTSLGTLTLSDGTLLPIGRLHSKTFRQALNRLR